jgi:hypothetical protein
MSFIRMKRFVALAGLLNLFALSLFACTYADGTLFPTDYDYIKQTDAIVLAEPVAKLSPPSSSSPKSRSNAWLTDSRLSGLKR